MAESGRRDTFDEWKRRLEAQAQEVAENATKLSASNSWHSWAPATANGNGRRYVLEDMGDSMAGIQEELPGSAGIATSKAEESRSKTKKNNQLRMESQVQELKKQTERPYFDERSSQKGNTVEPSSPSEASWRATMRMFYETLNKPKIQQVYRTINHSSLQIGNQEVTEPSLESEEDLDSSEPPKPAKGSSHEALQDSYKSMKDAYQKAMASAERLSASLQKTIDAISIEGNSNPEDRSPTEDFTTDEPTDPIRVEKITSSGKELSQETQVIIKPCEPSSCDGVFEALVKRLIELMEIRVANSRNGSMIEFWGNSVDCLPTAHKAFVKMLSLGVVLVDEHKVMVGHRMFDPGIDCLGIEPKLNPDSLVMTTSSFNLEVITGTSFCLKCIKNHLLLMTFDKGRANATAAEIEWMLISMEISFPYDRGRVAASFISLSKSLILVFDPGEFLCHGMR